MVVVVVQNSNSQLCQNSPPGALNVKIRISVHGSSAWPKLIYISCNFVSVKSVQNENDNKSQRYRLTEHEKLLMNKYHILGVSSSLPLLVLVLLGSGETD